MSSIENPLILSETRMVRREAYIGFHTRFASHAADGRAKINIRCVAKLSRHNTVGGEQIPHRTMPNIFRAQPMLHNTIYVPLYAWHRPYFIDIMPLSSSEIMLARKVPSLLTENSKAIIYEKMVIFFWARRVLGNSRLEAEWAGIPSSKFPVLDELVLVEHE